MGAKKGAFISGAVAVLAIIGLMTVFVSSASPYVTIEQARTLQGDRMHVAGDMVKGSLVNDVSNRRIKFQMKDEKGNVLPVIYTGPPLSNMGDAVKVVAIGGMKDGAFHSKELQLKCPSKYEASKPAY